MFKTFKESVSVSIKIHRSEFIAFLFYADDTSYIKTMLAAHNDKYKDATHNCYAYIIGSNQETQYYSDQGEPSGTAGKPILNTLLKHNLTNILAIVTRYYGGVKLGVRGLIEAYSETTEKAILFTELIDFVELSKINVVCDYTTLDSLKHILKQFDVTVLPKDFTDKVYVELAFPVVYSDEVNKILDELKIQGHLNLYEHDSLKFPTKEELC